jgi:hypothetical protein
MYSKALESLNCKEKNFFSSNKTFNLKNSLKKNRAKNSISEEINKRSQHGSSYSNHNHFLNTIVFDSKKDLTEKENFKQFSWKYSNQLSINNENQLQKPGRSLIDLANQRSNIKIKKRIPSNLNLLSNEA